MFGMNNRYSLGIVMTKSSLHKQNAENKQCSMQMLHMILAALSVLLLLCPSQVLSTHEVAQLHSRIFRLTSW
jgi:hypothetical protein